jgi:DNA-binding response OmpR family regulator
MLFDWLFFWRRRWPHVSFEEIRKRARLLVIDDQDFPYGVLFHRDGYNLDTWHDVEKLAELDDGKYDLVLLDLQGVGRQDSAEQGFGILKYLKRRCPTILVVAYSNAEWGLKYQEFVRLADAVFPKSADYLEFKARVDALLAERFSLGFYVRKVLDEAGPYEIDPAYLGRLTQTAILTGKQRRLRSHLQATIPHDSAAIIDRILSIVKVAIGILQLWSQ